MHFKCDRIIMNRRHNKCYNCYVENNQNKKAQQTSRINEYHSVNNVILMKNPRHADPKKH